MSYEINNDDIKRFIVSLDKAIKFSYATNEANDQNFPKILLGESRDYLDNEKAKPYTRPFVGLLLERRESASLSDTKFFSGMKQHGSISPSASAYTENDIDYFRKDNEFVLILRAKSKKEIYSCVQSIEKIFLVPELKKILDCELCIFVSSKEKREIEDDFFVAEVKIHVRTIVKKHAIDGAFFDKINITYGSLCRYYDLSSQKCTYSSIHGTKAEREDDADDIQCYNQWCKDYLKQN